MAPACSAERETLTPRTRQPSPASSMPARMPAWVPPLPVGAINWLNLFYAVEWVVFAGFAIFFWYRLVRDDWEKIHELKLLAVAESTAAEE